MEIAYLLFVSNSLIMSKVGGSGVITTTTTTVSSGGKSKDNLTFNAYSAL
jgi:hypothetical protein